MNVEYFRDTDTALLEFSAQPVDETKEISENVYVDLDKDGNLLSMTIEHAAQGCRVPAHPPGRDRCTGRMTRRYRTPGV
jgi:uncharacterized protein YuzE